MKIIKYLKNPKRLFFCLGMRGKLGFIPDKLYLNLMYWSNTGKWINIDNPKTYNEKLQWLKLYDRNPEYTKMVDKYLAKKYVSSLIGDEFIIPTLGVWDKFDDIEFENLPKDFVLKCTHDSGGLVICKDKSKLDLSKARKKINKSLKRNYYKAGREYPYKEVKPRIIAEKYMEDEALGELVDYKFYTFGGVPKVLFIASNRMSGNTCADYYDMDFNKLPFTWGYPNSSVEIKKPKNFEKMVYLAEILAKNTTELRVDFYEVNGKVYFGELTFFDGSGFCAFEPNEWDLKLGEYIVLP